MQFTGKVYEILKWLVLVVLPAISTFYGMIAPEFGWYDPGVISKVISAICFLIGSLIGISTASYYKEEKDKLAE